MEELKRTIRENWNQHAKDYDAQYLHGLKSHAEKIAWLKFLRDLIPAPQQEILDVGTGTGFLALLLAEQGHRCKGIDLSPGMLAEAISKSDAAGLSVQFAIGDAEQLTDEESDHYDIVINRHILWTMPHPTKAIEEWVRVLKPGGRLIVIDGDWFYHSFHNDLQIFLGKLLTMISGGGNLFVASSQNLHEQLPMTKPKNAKNAAKLLENAGLSVTVQGVPDVRKAERAGMPLRERLLNPHKRIVLIGQKQSYTIEANKKSKECSKG